MQEMPNVKMSKELTNVNANKVLLEIRILKAADSGLKVCNLHIAFIAIDVSVFVHLCNLSLYVWCML